MHNNCFLWGGRGSIVDILTIIIRINTCRTKRRTRVKNVNASSRSNHAEWYRFVPFLRPPRTRAVVRYFAFSSSSCSFVYIYIYIHSISSIIIEINNAALSISSRQRGGRRDQGTICHVAIGPGGGWVERGGQNTKILPSATSSSVYSRSDGDQGDPRARLPTFIKNSRRVPKARSSLLNAQ